MNDKLEQHHQEEIKKLIPLRSFSEAAQDQFLKLAEIAIIPVGSRVFDSDQERHQYKLTYLLEGHIERLEPTGDSIDLVVDDFAGYAINAFVKPEEEYIASSRLVVLTIDAKVLERLLSLGHLKHLPLDSPHITPILRSAIFSRIPVTGIPQLFNKFRAMFVKTGDQVVTQNMPGDYLYLIKDGTAQATYRAKELKDPVVIAEFESGDCFGEEALQENMRRQSSVVMLESGSLLKLSRKDYESLIEEEKSEAVSVDEAISLFDQGAYIIDVRSQDEFDHLHVQGSRSVPFSHLDSELISLPSDTSSSLLFVCQSGELSAAAVAQLEKHGRTAKYLKDGILSLPEQYLVRENQLDQPLVTETGHEEFDLLNEELDLSEPENHIPSEEDELQSINDQIDDVHSRIQDLKQGIIAETDEAQEWMSQEQLIDQAQGSGLLAEVSKRIEEIENKKTLSSKPEPEIEQESARTELSQLRKQLENAQNQLLEEHEKTREKQEGSEKELSLQRVSEELENIKIKLQEQETYELQRHRQFEEQLASERQKVRDQLTRFSLGMEAPPANKSLEVEKVKLIVAQEMRHVISRFKAMQAEQRLRQQQTIEKVRRQLQQQAAMVIAKARKANAEKEQALHELREARQQIEILRQQKNGQALSSDSEQSSTADVPLLVDIQSMGEKIDKAKRQLQVAESTLSATDRESQKNRDRLQKMRHTENEFKNDLVDWFQHNDQLNIQHEGLSTEQQLKLARVKKLAQEALEEALTGSRHSRSDDGQDDQAFNQYK